MDNNMETIKELIEKRYDNYAGHNSVVPTSAYELATLRSKFDDINKAKTYADIYKRRKTRLLLISSIVLTALLWTGFTLLCNSNRDFIYANNIIFIVGATAIATATTAINAVYRSCIIEAEKTIFYPFYRSIVSLPNCKNMASANKSLKLAEDIVNLKSEEWKTFKFRGESIDSFNADVFLQNNSEDSCADKCIKEIPLKYYNDSLPGFDFSEADGEFKDAIMFIDALVPPNIPEKFLCRMQRKEKEKV